ncbi:cytochrome P450 monooxygenase [Rhizodiscina lignyota]|uniref:Cytochrome P450 monooxygenase n=1 Tax=Rhizodiscina lignyota TaxID=1504668 RepID=A0A9P4M864_9PEZI|nr:cytochrome P450 monooxygenase [Rhizodiscina lignyota]
MAHTFALWSLIWQSSPYLLTTGLILIVLHTAYTFIYNIFFHPLRSFPGPKLAAATSLYYATWSMRGKRHTLDEQLHAKYGQVVRIKPNQLSFIGENCWKDIYMHRQGHPQMAKFNRGGANKKGAYSIINAPDDVHARQRKGLSHAFSEKALREQEPLIKLYIDLLVSNMREDAREGRPSNMALYFNWTTFDIVGDLSFAQSFDALRTRTTHPWIKAFFSGLNLFVILSELGNITVLRPIVMLFVLAFRSGTRQKVVREFCDKAVKKRSESGDLDRPDFLGKVLYQNSEKDEKAMMSDEEIRLTFNILMIAGSETTATLLAGCTYLLQRNPKVLEKLNAEVRSAFESEDDITMVKVNTLPYLLAVIEEALRLYPPVPVALSRVTPPEGTTICGYHVPGKVVVGIPQWAAGVSPEHFVDSHEFIPERFLPNKDEKFNDDRKAVLQPFSAGPRNCLGRNLAYAEMKLILARIIFNFDLQLVDKELKWMEQQKVYVLWQKPELMVKVNERA